MDPLSCKETKKNDSIYPIHLQIYHSRKNAAESEKAPNIHTRILVKFEGKKGKCRRTHALAVI